MSDMTYSSNLRISVFLSVQRIKRERKRDREKRKGKMVSHRRYDARWFRNQVPFPADAWIKLYYCGGGPAGKNGVIGRRKLCGNRLKSLKSRGLR